MGLCKNLIVHFKMITVAQGSFMKDLFLSPLIDLSTIYGFEELRVRGHMTFRAWVSLSSHSMHCSLGSGSQKQPALS